MKKIVSFSLFIGLAVVLLSLGITSLAAPASDTYNNLYASVQGETNAAAFYRASAGQAVVEGYPVIAKLFLTTADAEAKHADDEWAILSAMGATVRPTADAPKVGTTLENLKAAFDGETYEYTVMYPDFIAAATAEGETAAVAIFTYAMKAEEVHAGNYADVLALLSEGKIAEINTKYANVYRCLTCGEVVTTRPANCPICGRPGSTFASGSKETFLNLYASVDGETNAAAFYRASGLKALADGYQIIAKLFFATADAEAKHANDEWAILAGMGATVRPVAGTPTVGTTAENLLAAFNGETYEYTVMYPDFLATATAEGETAAAGIFTYAMKAEEVHAGNYADVRTMLLADNIAGINSKYAVIYRCVTCGEVVTSLPANCPICGRPGSTFAVYNQTYANLYASVHGETNAAAFYRASAAKALAEGYPVISRLFLATADAESKHAEDEWTILAGMGAVARPVAGTPTVGTTAENLLEAFNGETYEYTVMYPGFLATATTEEMTDAVRIFTYAMKAEEVHAGNYADVRTMLLADNIAGINSKYAVIYRCVTCGEVVTSLPANCPICGRPGSTFATYNQTYFNLYDSVQGETNAAAFYRASAAKALADGYPVIAQLFNATADAEAKHADDEWAILSGMGATVRPVAAVPTVGTTAENLQAAFDGETYEYTVMYPDFRATALAEGMTAAANIFRLAMAAEEVHAGNYADVLANIADKSYINIKYATVYRCVTCGEVVTSLPANCPICGRPGETFVVYNDTAYKPVIRIASVAVAPGGSVNVTYGLEGNLYGFTALDVKIPYISAVYGPAVITPASPLNTLLFVVNPAYDTNVMRIAFASEENITGDTLLFTVTYQIAPAAPGFGDYPLNLEVVKMQAESQTEKLVDLDIAVKAGTLVLGILGDVNCDGFVTPEDAMLILQMVVGLIEWTPRALLLGDINGDGLVDTTDAALILRMVVGG
ncbi:MAG: dockerin type I domain-containing protein [Clostridiales bacterium]|nr:dockerin type I domain-containing protein [Clostridiales bacterium]